MANPSAADRATNRKMRTNVNLRFRSCCWYSVSGASTAMRRTFSPPLPRDPVLLGPGARASEREADLRGRTRLDRRLEQLGGLESEAARDHVGRKDFLAGVDSGGGGVVEL